MVKPNVSMMVSGGGTEFPIYRESPQKLYVPRFYGKTIWYS